MIRLLGCLLAAILASSALAQGGSILRVTTQTAATVDTDAVFDGITGAGPFTVSWTSPTTGGAHQLNLTTTTNESAITGTFTGTDADGRTQTEAITLPNNTTVETVKYWRTVTGLTVSATLGADTMDVGYVDELVSPSIALNRESGIGAKFFLDITGTLNVDVQFTIADPALFSYQDLNLWVEPYATLTAETADSTAVVAADAGYGWYRIQWNSYSTGAVAKLYASQPGP